MRVQTPVAAVQNFGYPCYEGGIDANGNPYTRIRPASDAAEPEHLREPLQGGQRDGRAVLGLRPRAAGRAGREVHEGLAGSPAGSLLTGAAFYPKTGTTPGAIPGCAVLLRSAARLHLRAPARVGRPAAAWERRAVRRRTRCGRSTSRCSPGRRHALRRPGEQRGPAGRVRRYGCEPASDGSRDVEHHLGCRAAERRVRRERIERSRPRRRAHLRVGPGRRRRVRRLDCRRSRPYTYTKAGTYKVQLRVKDSKGGSAPRRSRSPSARRPPRRSSSRRLTRASSRTTPRRTTAPRAHCSSAAAQARRRELPALHGVRHHRPDSEREAATDSGSNATVDGPARLHRCEGHLDRDRHQVVEQSRRATRR